MKKYLVLTFFLLTFCHQLFAAGIVIQYSGGYMTFDNSESKIAFTRMNNAGYVGASLGRQAYFFLGPSYQIWSEEHTPTAGGNTEEVSMTEFGATLMVYFNKKQNWKLEATYCPKVSGERTVSGTEEEISGSSYQVSLGYHAEITERFVLGGKLSYHGINLDQKIVSNTSSEISETYTQIVPKLEIVLRF